MKVIAFSTSVYPNGFTPMSHRLHYYMKALQLEGANVEIVMPSREEKEGGMHENIPYSYVKVDSTRSRFSNRKVIQEYAEIFSTLAKRCNVVFTSEDRNYAILKLSKSVHAAGGKIVIELNENPYSIFSSRIDTRLFLNLKRWIFLHKILPKVDGIITISRALSDLVSKYKAEHAALVRIPVLSGEKEIKRSNLYKGVPYILHAGALSEQKDGVKAMLNSFKIAHHKLNGNLKFIFTSKYGFPSLITWIDKFIQKNGLTNAIEFKGIVSKEELETLYENCSLAILNKPSNPQNDFNFPTKLSELLPRSIPIIATATGELSFYFKDNVNAFLVEANNSELIADKIIYIISNPKEAEIVGANGRALAEKEFYYLNIADDLYKFYEKVTK